jgi:DNA modification methylase
LETRLGSIQYRSIASLRPNANNPRIHSKKQIRQIALSVKPFGFIAPILIDAEDRIIAGHGRVLAAQLLGMCEVPTIQIEHLSDHQITAFIVADNRLTENAEWDNRILGEQLKILSEAEIDFSLEVTGFEMSEIDLFIENIPPASSGKCDPADAIPEPLSRSQITRIGDCWILARHRVYCGDARADSSYSALMDGQRANMVFADPPYNDPIDGYVGGFGKIHHPEFAVASGEMSSAEFTQFLRNAFEKLARHSSNGSLHYIFMDWRHTQEILSAASSVYSEFKNLCIWVKDNGGQGSLYRSQHELVFVFKSGTKPHRNNVQLGQYGRYRTNVWNYRRVNSLSRGGDEGSLAQLHPTLKPVELVADAILDSSARGDLILDAFLGSGTTIIAAERTGRICYGIELDPRYVDTIVRRWQSFTGQSAILESRNRSFNEIEEEINGRRE